MFLPLYKAIWTSIPHLLQLSIYFKRAASARLCPVACSLRLPTWPCMRASSSEVKTAYCTEHERLEKVFGCTICQRHFRIRGNSNISSLNHHLKDDFHTLCGGTNCITGLHKLPYWMTHKGWFQIQLLKADDVTPVQEKFGAFSLHMLPSGCFKGINTPRSYTLDL